MPGIGLGLWIGRRRQTYWTQQEINDSCLFFASHPTDLLSKVSATHLPNQVTGSSDFLTVTGSGLNARYRTPDNATYRTADSDYVFWKSDASESTCDGNRLIAYDFPRILVKYLNVTPYTILWIAILKPGVTVTDGMRDAFDLSIWWNNTLSAHGATKQNRGIGQSVWLPEEVLTTQYSAVFNALTTKPGTAIKAAQNVFVKALVDGGQWAKLDRLFVFAQTVNSASEALLDWIHPADAAKRAALISTPAFTALEGFAGNGSSHGISSEYNPTTDAVNYALNNGSAGAYNRANKAGEAGNIFGCVSYAGAHEELVLYNRYTDNNMYHKNNSANAYLSFANADARGMFISTRSVNGTAILYKNKTPNSGGQVADRIPTQKIAFLCSISTNGNYAGWSTDQISLGFFGSGLTQTDVDIITDAFEVYMDSNGKGVIP